MYDVIAARALHLLAVVIWIGGVSLITTVALPAMRKQFGDRGPAFFEAIERRFAQQARAAVAVVGLTGFYMVWRLDLWRRFVSSGFWWMHAMVCLWLIFALLLFVAEPLILHRRLRVSFSTRPDVAFARLLAAHRVLLLFAVITVFGAVAGAQGWSIF